MLNPRGRWRVWRDREVRGAKRIEEKREPKELDRRERGRGEPNK